jgi:hypothetical protein
MVEGQINSAMELLLCCVQPGAPARSRLLSLLQTPIDWVEVFRLGLVHGALPRVFGCLVEFGSPGVPEATLAMLGRYTRISAAKNRALAGELLEIVSALKSADVAAVPFKGPAMAAWLYGDLNSRQCGDLDILVRRRDISAAQAALRSRGYRPWRELSHREEEWCLRNEKDRVFLSNDGKFAVEVHWRFAPGYYRFPMDADSLWDRLESRPFEGTPMLGIPREEMLLILCVHGTRHQWSSLKWVCDIAMLVSRERDMNWEQIVGRAGRMGIERALLTGLFLANALLDAPLPAIARNRIEKVHPVVRRLAMQAWLGMTSPVDREKSSFAAKTSFQIASRERLRDRLFSLAHFAISKMPWAHVAPAPLRPRFQLGPAIRLVQMYGFRNLCRLVRSTVEPR